MISNDVTQENSLPFSILEKVLAHLIFLILEIFSWTKKITLSMKKCTEKIEKENQLKKYSCMIMASKIGL